MKRILATLFALTTLSAPALARDSAQEEKNKELVRTFYEDVFVRHLAKEAAEKYLAPDYKQHNPHVPTGRQPFIDYFVPYFAKDGKEARSEIKRILADGDLVAVHVHAKRNKDDRGTAVVDIFRVKDGKIVEHWDVLQAVPEKQAHTNTMF